MATPLPSEVDVLIIGAGPAGLMLALWLARLGVVARIVDKRTDKVFSGQADGFQARTLEILDSFGVGERVWKEANHMIEVSFWNPDAEGRIRRDHRAPNNIPGLSRFTECVLHQGRVEQFFLDAIAASYPHLGSETAGREEAKEEHRIRVERMVAPTSLVIDEEGAATSEDYDVYPVTVTLRHLTEAEATPTQRLSNLSDGLFRSSLGGESEGDAGAIDGDGDGTSEGGGAWEETVRAKYVVGCDGAHSWTRKALGKEFEMRGEMTDSIWGVLDIVPITNFPDIRNRCIIHSAASGSLMIIPRENRLVRLYIQLNEVSPDGGRVDRSKITPEVIFKAAQNILSPFTLEYHYCDWWTAYQIGQRIGDKFSKLDRVFLAGDAVHTHSPKAGQGMNVSMQDAYNLGWKLGLVCKGILRQDILSTYELERKDIAQQLIAFDQKFSAMFSGRPAKDIMDETGVSMDELSKAFDMSHMFTSGIGVNYKPSNLVAKAVEERNDTVEGDHDAETATTQSKPVLSERRLRLHSTLAKNCVPGTRFPSHRVLAQSDARIWELHEKMPSDGRFRIVVFGGDVGDPAQRERVNAFGGHIELEASSLHQRTLALSPASSSVKLRAAEPTSILHVLLVHTAERGEIEPLRDLSDAYYPCDPRLGNDYDRIFVDGVGYDGRPCRTYGGYGVDPAAGAVVVVRPDGYVGLVTSLDSAGCDDVSKWFKAVLRTRPKEGIQISADDD